jgi:hypothetical protein
MLTKANQQSTWQSLAGNPNSRAFTTIVKRYRENNLFLAEAARELHQNMKYEIPVVEAQLSEISKVLSSIHRRLQASERASDDIESKLLTNCSALGLQTENVLDAVTIVQSPGLSLALRLSSSRRALQLLVPVHKAVTDSVFDAIHFYREFAANSCLWPELNTLPVTDSTKSQLLIGISNILAQMQQTVAALYAAPSLVIESKSSEVDWISMIEFSGAGEASTGDDHQFVNAAAYKTEFLPQQVYCLYFGSVV